MSDTPPDRSTIDDLRDRFRARLESSETVAALKALQDQFLSRKSGTLTGLMKTLGSLPQEARREFGSLVNTLKTDIENAIEEKRQTLESSRPPAGAVDITLPGRSTPIGHVHPLMRVRQQVEDIFTRMGYEILEGPEVEDDFHNFEALNMPPEHPARDMQDTLYLGAPIVGSTWGAHRSPAAGHVPEAQVRAATLLRTHTSAMQIRYMKTFPPPVRIIVPGRVYRRDNLDLTHTPMFQQFEGLVVGPGVSMADLKGTFEAMLTALFGRVKVRLRPSFFPYTEPSAEVDISCQSCGGSGCSVCKHTGWLEILGSGMVHPAVFEAVGYDPEQISGFAFGMGLERVAMLKYGVDNIRLFYENDVRFLEQFPRPMKILLSWLREFVDVPGTAEQIATTMSVRGFAVEGIESLPDDAVIDFEVTANRPDCLSVAGMAREIATAYGLQVRRPVAGGSSLALTSLKSVDQGDIEIAIENKDLCPRYVGAVADVTVGPSPEWMQARLRAAGVRPISNIVDITNYVLLELGQPMHAFDITKLGGGQIRVRTAQTGETLRTLDGQTRTLTPEMLVIADAERPVAIAGVMGGADSEVSADTQTIVFESAYFTPPQVRRTSKALGLKTEASTRFERGTDPRLPVTAMERACALLELVHAGTARGTLIDRYPLRLEPTLLRLRRDRISGLLGTAVPDTDIKRILESLGFALREADAPSTSPGAGGWDVTVPTRRVDVVREVDLIEEVARHYGFDRIPVTFPALTTPPPPMDPRITQSRALRAIMTGAGFSEAVTFGFVSEHAAAPFAPAADLVPIANPLSESFAVLRPSVLPGLVAAVAHNRRREQRDVRLFEMGARFSRSRGERRALAFAWTGAVGADHWSGGTRPIDYFDVQGVVQRVCQALRRDARMEGVAEPWLVPGRGAAIMVDGARIGAIGLLTSSIVEQHELPASDAIYVAEIDLDSVPLADDDLQVEALPRHPSMTRDISILVADTLAAGTVRHTVQSNAPDTLVRISEFDRYQGKGIPEGHVSLSLRLTFRAPDRTLTDAEVQKAVDGVLAALKVHHAAVQR